MNIFSPFPQQTFRFSNSSAF